MIYPPSFISSVLYSQINSTTIDATTTAEQSLINTSGALGSNIIPANTMQVGDVIGFTFAVLSTNPATQINIVMRTYLNALKLGESPAATALNVNSPGLIVVTGSILVLATGASGSIIPQGFAIGRVGPADYFTMINAAALTIDTTAAQTFNLTGQYPVSSTSSYTMKVLGPAYITLQRVAS